MTASRRRKAGPSGAPEWLVTFADLMSLLVCFFVLIISFSNQDEKKLKIVAGSMRDAFGSQMENRQSGMIEIDGFLDNHIIRDPSIVRREANSDLGGDRDDERLTRGAHIDFANRNLTDNSQKFLSAAASLRQALQDMPDIAEISRNIVFRTDEQGLHIELTDLDGRSMFGEGSADPYPHTREILERIAPVLRRLAHPITLTGHTTAGQIAGADRYTHWELSSDRAQAARRLLVGSGLPADRVAAVVGRGDADPLFVDDPWLTANRRVTILLLDVEAPIPSQFRL